MRRLLLPTLAAAMLVSASSSPVRAEGWKEYRDCVSFTIRWCLLAREDTNELEETAVDALCAVLILACTAEIF